MTIRSLAALATLGLAMLLGGCGGGSGRSGTDLAVSGVGPSASLNGGDPAIFSMTVVNQGEFAASNVTVRNVTSQLSAPTVVILCTATGGVSCPAQTSSTMTFPSMPAGSKLVFQISATSNLGASGDVSDTMSVSSDSAETDASNNSVTASAVVASNDVSVVATPPTGPLVEGPATFTMVVDNAGPDDAKNVVLTTTTSTNVSFVPSAVRCVANANTGTIPTPVASVPVLQSDGTLIAALIPATGGLTCSIPVTVADATNGFAIVTMTAVAPGDSHAGNNAGTGTVNATLINDLSVTATAPIGPLVNGTAAFTMVIDNAGPSTATNVVLTNTLGPNLTLSGPISCVPSGGATAPALQPNGTLIAASIPANGALSCTVPTSVAAGTNGIVQDTMSVSTTDDPKTANNTATAAVNATLVNNVNVAIDPSRPPPASVPGGGTTTFSFVVGNTGPATAASVTLSNTLTAGLGYQGAISCVAAGGAAAPPAFTVSGPTATSLASTIPVGGTLTCAVPVMVTAGTNGTVGSTFGVAAANDQISNLNNTATASTVAASADLGVSETVPATVTAGNQVTFTAVVANPRSQGTVNNVTINWAPAVQSGVTFAPPTCAASPGATCPSVLVSTMTAPSMLTGSSLTFTFVATTTTSARGTVGSTVTIAAAGDPNTANNTVTANTTVVDPRNGTYTTFGADGKPYSLTFDFDNLQYTVAGSSTVRHFTAVAGTTEYVVGGNTRFRVAADLIAGGDDFGSGRLPYVAARTFATTVNAIQGAYDLGLRNTPTSGPATTHAATAMVQGNTLFICESDTTVATTGQCPGGALKGFDSLTANSDQTFTAKDSSATNAPFTFSVAISGASKVLLAAGTAADTSKQFTIGVPDLTALVGGMLGGATSSGDWGTMTLTGTSYDFSASSSSDDSAVLGKLPGIGVPGSMLTGTLVSSGARIYVMQASPVAVTVGDFSGLSSGLLQVALP